MLGRLHRSLDGFSLVEIVMALGIISFAIIGIMGLFPVAMQTALESQRETRATQIAQQIFADLQSGAPSSCYLATGTNILSASDRVTVNLLTAGSYSASYNGDGLPVASTTPAAVFHATLSVAPNVPSAGLSRMQATIQAPSATSTNAARYVFTTIMEQD